MGIELGRALRVLAGGGMLAVLVACATPYQSRGLAGGFTDEQLGENVFAVSFQGNGNTSGDMVWNYWIYRCAELTLQRGYSAFGLRRDEPRGGRHDVPSMVTAKGGGYTTIYLPPTTITTHRAHGVVVMFKPPLPPGARQLLDADHVVRTLKPYVDSAGKAGAPSRRELLDGAMRRAAPPA